MGSDMTTYVTDKSRRKLSIINDRANKYTIHKSKEKRKGKRKRKPPL